MTQALNAYLKTKDGKELPIPAGLTPQQALDHHSLTYPELTTATVGAGSVDTTLNKIVYNVSETLGTKG